jgi:hypothetical protein
MTHVNHLLTHRCRLRMRSRRRVGLERSALNIDTDRWAVIRGLANGTSVTGQRGVEFQYVAPCCHSELQPALPTGSDSVRSTR